MPKDGGSAVTNRTVDPRQRLATASIRKAPQKKVVGTPSMGGEFRCAKTITIARAAMLCHPIMWS